MILLAFACGDGATGPSELPVASPADPVDAISDGENDGNPHFYFLPPVVVEPAPTGTFDPTVTPRVEICESDLTGCVVEPFATFTFGATDDHVRLVAEDEHYILTWHTNEWNLVEGAYYRLTVFQASFELGFVDVAVYANGSGQNARTGETFALKDGRTLPLIFRIEEGAAAMAPASAQSTDGAAAVQAPPGALQEYEELTVEPVDETTTELPDDGAALEGTVYDFGPDGLTFEEPVELNLAYDPATLPVGVLESDLRVYLAGPDGWELLPGGSVDLATNQVKGLTTHFSEFAILPGGVETCGGSGYGTLEEALAAVGPEGTITVCDGAHAVEGVVVSKPVTIQAEAGATPVLQTSTSAALFVDGVASGTVVLDGLTFDYSAPDPLPSGVRAYAIRLENEYDQVLIQNSTFTIDPASRGSVAAFASSVPTAAVTLGNVDVTGGVFGVTTLGPDLFVSGSRFNATTFRTLGYFGGASGTVQTSTFDDCLGSQCVMASSPGGHVEIIGNDFGVPDLSGARAPSVNQIVRYQLGTTGLIEDNDFAGCGEFRCVFVLSDGTDVGTRNNRLQVDPTAEPFNTDFHAVIRYQTDAVGTIEGNQITSCFEQCISALARAVVTVRDNTITLPDGLPTVHAIAGEGGADPGPGMLPDPADAPQLVIENNTVTAGGIPSDPADPAAYDLDVGIWLSNAQATISANSITRAATGIASMEGASVNGGQDNVIQSTWVAIRTNSIGAGDSFDDGRVTLTFSDILDYREAMWVAPGDASSDVTCNFWGPEQSGVPQSFLHGNAPALSTYAPWATAPIANGAGGACDGSVPTDVTVDPANASDPTTFATLDEALGAVAEGGRVGVADGTHVLASDLWVTKPVLIEGNGPGRPTIDGTATFAAFILQTPGTVTLRNLHILGGDIAVNIREDFDTPYDNILIDDVVVEAMAGGEGITAWVPGHPADGRRIDIVGSTVTGGARGISAHDGVPEIVVNNTTLSGQTDGFAAALEFGVGVTGTVESSTFNGCSNACIQVGANDPTQGASLIQNNQLYPDLTVPTAEAIRVWGGSVQVLGNHIEGQGGTLNPNDHTTWPIHSSGILVANVGSLDVSGNTVLNTFRALVFESQVGAVTGSDNVIDVAQTAIQVDDVASLALHNSDFTNFSGGWIGDLDADVTCNWWGDALNPPIGASDPSLYTPWASAPIANGAGGACDGGL